MAETLTAKRKDLNRQIQLAGMTIGDSGSRVGRKINTEGLLKPAVVDFDREARQLAYNTDSPLTVNLAGPPPGLLDEFVGLYEASDEAIWRFAQRFGVLSVAPFREHGTYTEPIAEWRYRISQARAVLAIAAALHQGHFGWPEDWRAADSATLEAWTNLFKRQGSLNRSKRLSAERMALRDLVNHWIVVYDVRPSFTWNINGIGFSNLHPTVDDAFVTLSGALALQLALACSRADSIAICASCRRPYARRWHSPSGRRNFCSRCGLKAAWRESKRAIRAHAKRGR